MDISLHDTISDKNIFYDTYILQSSITSVVASGLTKKKLAKINYIEPFFVGLLEGDGTITTRLSK